jgi:hypothetical protein
MTASTLDTQLVKLLDELPDATISKVKENSFRISITYSVSLEAARSLAEMDFERIHGLLSSVCSPKHGFEIVGRGDHVLVEQQWSF